VPPSTLSTEAWRQLVDQARLGGPARLPQVLTSRPEDLDIGVAGNQGPHGRLQVVRWCQVAARAAVRHGLTAG
jgi:hypothetical protein